LDDLHYRSPSSKHYPYQRRFGDRRRFVARRPANPITLCDGHGAGFMTVTGQILMAVRTAPAGDYRGGRGQLIVGGVRRRVLPVTCNPGCRVVSGRF
jgi:hypothetical protein